MAKEKIKLAHAPRSERRSTQFKQVGIRASSGGGGDIEDFDEFAITTPSPNLELRPTKEQTTHEGHHSLSCN